MSGTQTVTAYVTPYSAAAGLTFSVTKPSEAIISGPVAAPVQSGNTAIVPLTLVGQSGNARQLENGSQSNRFLTARSLSMDCL